MNSRRAKLLPMKTNKSTAPKNRKLSKAEKLRRAKTRRLLRDNEKWLKARGLTNDDMILPDESDPAVHEICVNRRLRSRYKYGNMQKELRNSQLGIVSRRFERDIEKPHHMTIKAWLKRCKRKKQNEARRMKATKVKMPKRPTAARRAKPVKHKAMTTAAILQGVNFAYFEDRQGAREVNANAKW